MIWIECSCFVIEKFKLNRYRSKAALNATFKLISVVSDWSWIKTFSCFVFYFVNFFCVVIFSFDLSIFFCLIFCFHFDFVIEHSNLNMAFCWPASSQNERNKEKKCRWKMALKRKMIQKIKSKLPLLAVKHRIGSILLELMTNWLTIDLRKKKKNRRKWMKWELNSLHSIVLFSIKKFSTMKIENKSIIRHGIDTRLSVDESSLVWLMQMLQWNVPF